MGAFHLEKKNPEISVGAKVDFPIGKKFFHFVVNSGAGTKMAAQLVDEDIEILFGFDEEEDINVIAAT